MRRRRIFARRRLTANALEMRRAFFAKRRDPLAVVVRGERDALRRGGVFKRGVDIQIQPLVDGSLGQADGQWRPLREALSKGERFELIKPKTAKNQA